VFSGLGVFVMIYELRIYTCVPGRLKDLTARFQNATLRIWAKHGIAATGFWTTVIGPSNNDLTYMIAWESLADREAKWASFVSDPEWLAAVADSERNGPLIANIASSFLKPTSFSNLK